MRSRLFRCILLAAVVAAAAAAPLRAEPKWKYVCPRISEEAIRIDADLSEWEAVPNPIAFREENLIRGTACYDGLDDLSGGMHLAWSDRTLFVAAEAVDEAVIQTQEPAESWHHDHAFIRMDLRPGLEPWRGLFGEGQLRIGLVPGRTNEEGTTGPDDPYVMIYHPEPKRIEGARIASRRTPTGYIVEAAVPFAALGIEDPATRGAVMFEAGLWDWDPDTGNVESNVACCTATWLLQRWRLLPFLFGDENGKARDVELDPMIERRLSLSPEQEAYELRFGPDLEKLLDESVPLETGLNVEQAERIRAALTRAAELQGNAGNDFAETLQSVAHLLPEVSVGTTHGECSLASLEANHNREGLAAVRFRTPADEPRDMVWCFYLRKSALDCWYIMPANQPEMPRGGFRNYSVFEDPFEHGGESWKVFQFLAADKLERDKEYILWWKFHDRTDYPLRIRLAINCLPQGRVENSKEEKCKALGRTAPLNDDRRNDWFNRARASGPFNNERLAETRRAWEEDPENAEAALMYLFTLSRLKLYRQAEAFGEKAIEIAERSGDKEVLFCTLHTQAATIRSDDHADRSPGNSRRLNEYHGERYAKRLLGLAEELDSDNLRYRASLLHAMWSGHALGGSSWDVATDYYRRVIFIAAKHGWADRIHTGHWSVEMALACRMKPQWAIDYARRHGVAVHPFVHRQLRDWNTIYERHKGTIDYLEAATRRQPTERLQRQVIGWNQRGSADEFIVACLHLEKYGEAVESYERLQNRTLGMILGARMEDRRAAIVERRKDEEAQAQRRLREIEKKVAVAEQEGDAVEVTSLQRDLSVQATALESLADDIAVEELEIELAREPERMTVADMQKLLDSDTALIIYGVTWTAFNREGMIAVVTSDDLTVRIQDGLLVGTWDHRNPDRLTGLQATTAPYIEALARPDRDAETDAALRKGNDALYRLLIEPIRDEIAGKRHLVIVPGGPLCRVPIHLLADGNGRRLIESHSVSYAQSVGVLRFSLMRNRKVGGEVSVVANPALAGANAALKFAQDEAEAIREVFPNANILAGDRATETAVKELLPRSDTLHFACHGLLNTEYPMRSALALTPDAENDGLLTAREVCDYPLNTGLVVLSACQSGAGAMSAGWIELVGMSRAWLLAGAPSVVVSLWKIDDRATSELMAAFYRNLRTMGRAEALQQAQLAMMKKYDNPYYWGAFVLYGDYR